METIIKKYLEGIATEEEQLGLLVWLREKKNRALFNKVKSEWRDSVGMMSLPQGGEEGWNDLQRKLWQKSYHAWQISVRIHKIFRYAAVFLLILTVGGLTFLFNNRLQQMADISTRVIADKGQISKVELPDGSTLWLNSGSEVVYNNCFASKNREIFLTGEAYFRVSKNPGLPFIVICDNIHVKALGTEFNISAYPGTEFIDVVLEEGSVELSNKDIKAFRHVLLPGKRARFYTIAKKFNVTDVNITKYTSWKDGTIHIYDQPFNEVIKRLELRYNQKFIFEDGLRGFRYTFTIKNESLDEIIRLMEKITPVKAIQKDNIILFKVDKNKLRNVD